MILCFGTFASLLHCCGSPQLPRNKFVPRVAWVIDTKNSSLGRNLTSDKDFAEVTSDVLDIMEGNPPVVSRLLSCQRPLELKNKRLPSVETATKRFEDAVMPFIDKDSVAKAVLGTLHIIYEDETIGVEHRENFKKYFEMYKEDLLRQTEFNAPAFFARVLLYTTCVDNTKGRSCIFPDEEPPDEELPHGEDKEGLPCENGLPCREGRSCVKTITTKFVEEIIKESWADLKWDAVTQTVKLIPTEEKHFHDEIQNISKRYFSSIINPMYIDSNISWLGVDESALFPGIYPRIELDDEKKKIAKDKMMQYIKLTHKLVNSLTGRSNSTESRIAAWPIFPDKKLRDLRQQLSDLGCELMLLGLFSSNSSATQDQEEHY
ncbi:MAG: hypothetical protein HDT33_08465 [Clostridiales bacterium]|nr:hypothetical protein [Clostridiales bacterium]